MLLACSPLCVAVIPRMNLVKLVKWHDSSKKKGVTKFLAVWKHGWKRTHEVRHNFSLVWVWKEKGVDSFAHKPINLRRKEKKQQGKKKGKRVDLVLQDPFTKKPGTLHRVGCTLKSGPRDSSWSADHNNLRGGWVSVDWQKIRWRRGKDPDQAKSAASRSRA